MTAGERRGWTGSSRRIWCAGSRPPNARSNDDDQGNASGGSSICFRSTNRSVQPLEVAVGPPRLRAPNSSPATKRARPFKSCWPTASASIVKRCPLHWCAPAWPRATTNADPLISIEQTNSVLLGSRSRRWPRRWASAEPPSSKQAERAPRRPLVIPCSRPGGWGRSIRADRPPRATRRAVARRLLTSLSSIGILPIADRVISTTTKGTPMNGFYGLTNELVADRHREYLHEAEQRRRIRQAAASRDRWTHGFVTRVRTALTRDRFRTTMLRPSPACPPA